jgi:small subunit ribosomal protein S6
VNVSTPATPARLIASAGRARTKEYETIYILRSEVDSETAERIQTRVNEAIEREHGRLVKVESWGNLKLQDVVIKHMTVVTNEDVDLAALQIDPEEIKLAKFELPAEPEVEESREKQLGLIDLGPDAPRSMRRGPDELEEFPEEEVDADAVVAAAAAKPAAEPTPPAGASGGEET